MSQTDLKSWLRSQSDDGARLIGTRAGLRMVPLLAIDGLKTVEDSGIYLPQFRCIRSSLMRNFIFNKETLESAFKSLNLAYAVSKNYDSDVGCSIYSIGVLSTAHDYKLYLTQSVNFAVDKGKFDGVEVFLHDKDSFEENIATDVIRSRPIWNSNQEPEWSLRGWQLLKDHLARFPDEQWHVWIDWWEERRDGKPYNIEMEREIVLIPDEDWEKGPAHVNAMIAEIRARYATKDIPADNPFAPRFETVENRVVLRADTPDVLPCEEQAGLYEALREQVVELCGLCPENSNRYGAQGKAVVRFLAALGEDYGSMRLSALWLAGQKMRRFARADDAKRAAADPEDDPMEPDQSALFAEVVMTYNVFSTGEPGLKAKDEKGRDPATLSPDVTEEARAVRGAVAETPVLFDEDVPLVLDDVIEEAVDPVPGVAARGVVLTRETFENLLGALARKARTEPKPEPSEIGKGAKAAIGAGAVGGSAVVASAFIAAYETTLIAFAAKLPASSAWIGIIKSIAAKWDKFI